MIIELFLEFNRDVDLCWAIMTKEYKSVINVLKDAQFVVHQVSVQPALRDTI